jgi:hypothetical protein
LGSLKKSKNMKEINSSRTIVFATLAAALASNRVFGYQEIAVIKGDNTRFKRGDGERYSGTSPKPFVGNTFSQLPWVYTDGVTSKTPGTTYAANATATLTAAQLINKYITSTSAAATSLTLPTATLLATALGAVKGTVFDFTVDNSAGANIVTLIVGTGITAAGIGALTIPVGRIGLFKIIFTSTTTALLYRVIATGAADVVALTDSSTGTSGGNTVGAITTPALSAWDGATVFPSAADSTAITTAITALKNAVATLAAKQNAILTSLKNEGIML